MGGALKRSAHRPDAPGVEARALSRQTLNNLFYEYLNLNGAVVPEFPPPNPALSKNSHSLLSGARRGRQKLFLSFGEGKVLGNVFALGRSLP